VYCKSEIDRGMKEREKKKEIAIPSSPQRWPKFPNASWEINRFDI